MLIVCFITEKKRKKGDIFLDSIKPKGKCIGKVRVHSTAGLNQPGDSSLQALCSGLCSMKPLRVLVFPSFPPGWGVSPSQGTQHEATSSITTPPWMGC